jgi:hypothetical protein
MRFAFVLLVLLGCENQNEPALRGQGSNAAPPSKATTASAAAPDRTGAPSVVASAPPPPPASLSAVDFCKRVTALSYANYKGAAQSTRDNISALHYVKPLRLVAEECRSRVQSPQVEFHPAVAARCLEAAHKRGPETTFYAFSQISDCRSVLTGKAKAGQAVRFHEECAPGLNFVRNRCRKPAAKNERCAASPGGFLGSAQYPRCEKGLRCFMLGRGRDKKLIFRCLEPKQLGERCKVSLNLCAKGLACYQGKCKERGGEGATCMSSEHCRDGLHCKISGGVFGICVANPDGRPDSL